MTFVGIVVKEVRCVVMITASVLVNCCMHLTSTARKMVWNQCREDKMVVTDLFVVEEAEPEVEAEDGVEVEVEAEDGAEVVVDVVIVEGVEVVVVEMTKYVTTICKEAA